MTIAKFRMPRKSLLSPKNYEINQSTVENVMNKVATIFDIKVAALSKKVDIERMY